MQIRPIPGFAPYEVSESGQVYRRKTDGSLRLMSRYLGEQGYLRITLRVAGKYVTRKVHQLVALAFIGSRLEGMEVCHNDGDKLNNHYSNLRYDTRIGNVSDQRKHGTVTTGEYHGQAVLTGVQVEEIRNEIATKYRPGLQRDLSRKYGVSEGTICRVKKGLNWKDGYRTRGISACTEKAPALAAVC